MTSGEGASARYEPDSKGCLLIVASFANVAPVVDAVTQETGARIMMSPMLGDFIEMRFVDLGPRPGQASLHAAVVARIMREFTRPDGSAEGNYFALAIIDWSTVVKRLLGKWTADPTISALPLRCRGLATIDNCSPGAEPAKDSGPSCRRHHFPGKRLDLRQCRLKSVVTGGGSAPGFASGACKLVTVRDHGGGWPDVLPRPAGSR